MSIKTGDRFVTTINGNIVQGLIYRPDGRIDRMYLCQNVCDGECSPDRLGYKYSWVCSVDPSHHKEYGVENFKIIKTSFLEEKEICRNWEEGDVLIKDGVTMNILFRFKDLVICESNFHTNPENYNINLLVTIGWRLKEPESNNDKRKLTLNELIIMAGLDPDEIQII